MSLSHHSSVNPDTQSEATKECPKCKRCLPVQMFSNNRIQCKECIANYHHALYGKGDRQRPYRPSHLASKEKFCPHCKRVRPASEYGVRGGGRFLKSYCNNCEAEVTRRRNKEQRLKHAARIKAAQNRWGLYVQHSMSVADYESLLAAQGGVCGICKSTSPGKRKRFSVDHDHATNAIRGLLCDTCNRGIGMLKESKEVLLSAVAYLEKPPTGLISVCRRSSGHSTKRKRS